MTLKLLTLNTHSLIEPEADAKRQAFVDVVKEIRPSIIALQEVNQSPRPQALVGEGISQDNYGVLVAESLGYHMAWLPIKLSYGRYEEGVAILSHSPILETRVCCVSPQDNPRDWKTRKILGVRTQNHPHVWFYSVHYGWWQDPDAPFAEQWRKTLAHLKGCDSVILAGDFNNPAEVKGEGYDMVRRSGFYDAYTLAEARQGSYTVPTHERIIDGWHGYDSPKEGMRIDQVWMSRPWEVSYYGVMFDGRETPVVSDHFGVLTEICMEDERK